MTISPQLLTGLGSAFSIFLAAAGSAFASSHAGIYAVRGKGFLAFPPLMISGVLAIYGIIVSVLLVGKFKDDMTEIEGYRNFSAGLSVGLACCASGLGIASFMRQINEHSTVPVPTTTSDRPEDEPLIGRRENGIFAHQPTNVINLLMSLVFLEAIGLYGLIVALFLMG
jgi:V-type H+-transporting ATPase proteolipid subunit